VNIVEIISNEFFHVADCAEHYNCFFSVNYMIVFVFYVYCLYFTFYIECRPVSLKSSIVVCFKINKLTYLLTYLLSLTTGMTLEQYLVE